MKKGTRLLLATNALTAAGLLRAARPRLAPAIRIEGGVRARHPEDLNRGLPARADGLHRYRGRNYFEWWYFDARFSDGHACVVSFLDPDIYRLTGKESQVLFNVYTPDGRGTHNFFNFPREMFHASEETCDVSLAGNTVRGDYPEWKIDLEHDGYAAHLTYRNSLPGWTLGSGELLFGSLQYPRVFGWAVPQPRAEVTGTIAYPGAEVEVKGTGYHDHNWGNLVMPLYVSHWHWGRIYHEEVTVVFADVATRRRCGGVHIPLLLLGRGDRLEMETCRAEWRYEDYRSDAGGTQVYPRRMYARFEERDVKGTIEFAVREELEINDLLTHAGLPLPLREGLARAVAQPCYYRFLSDYSISLDLRGERLEAEGETIQEYMIFTLRRGQVPGGEFRPFV